MVYFKNWKSTESNWKNSSVIAKFRCDWNVLAEES